MFLIANRCVGEFCRGLDCFSMTPSFSLKPQVILIQFLEGIQPKKKKNLNLSEIAILPNCPCDRRVTSRVYILNIPAFNAQFQNSNSRKTNHGKPTEPYFGQIPPIPQQPHLKRTGGYTTCIPCRQHFPRGARAEAPRPPRTTAS